LFDKYNATERDKNGVDKGRVQMVEGTVVGVTGDYEAPDTIKMQDDTNKDRIKGKVDTFNYRKLTDEEIAAGKTKDGKTIQIPDEIKNAGKPLYILETAVNEKNQDIKAKHEEVYQLNLEKSEDGKTYNYKLEQYKGMSGSGVTSAVPAKTTTVKKAVTKPATGTGKADKAKTKEADPSTGKTEKEAAPIQYQYKFKGGTVVVPSPNEKGVYIDNATGDKYKRRPNGNFVKISSGTAKDTGKADKAKAKADPSTGTAKGTNKPKEAWINLQPGPVKGKGYMSDAERVRDAVTAKLPKFVNPAIIDEAVKQYQKGGLNAMNKYLQSQGFNYEFKAAV
jgi:hypothetical protein